MSQSLISALRSGRFFDGPADDPQIHETPGSWVVLAGEYAFKIRKPLEHESCDLSSTAGRRHACEREVRRCRRLAVHLDGGVVPITGTPEAPVIDGEGAAFEYAIRMRRFDPGRLFSNLQSRGELTFALMDDLIDQLVELHRHAARAAPDDDSVSPASLCALGRRNIDRIRPLLDRREDIRRLDELSLQIEELGERLAPLVEKRLADGRVVEVQGSPDLTQVVAYGKRALLFGGATGDAPCYRDVSDDLAALLMDLEARGAHPKARQALNRYLERSGDYDLIKLLPWYRIQRALTAAGRALIDAAPSARDAALETFRHHATLAESYGEIDIPWLLISVGVTGSGKSRFTEQVVRSLGGLRIRSDIERKRLHGLGFDEKPPATGVAFYGAESTQATYERLATLAGKLLLSGYPVCVDATTLKRAQRDRLRLEAQKRGLAALLISFEADEATLEARVLKRSLKKGDVSGAGLEVLRQQMAAREAFDSDELPWLIHLDTTAEKANLTLVSLIRERLRLH